MWLRREKGAAAAAAAPAEEGDSRKEQEEAAPLLLGKPSACLLGERSPRRADAAWSAQPGERRGRALRGANRLSSAGFRNKRRVVSVLSEIRGTVKGR